MPLAGVDDWENIDNAGDGGGCTPDGAMPARAGMPYAPGNCCIDSGTPGSDDATDAGVGGYAAGPPTMGDTKAADALGKAMLPRAGSGSAGVA